MSVLVDAAEDLPEADCLEGARHPRFAERLVGQEQAQNQFLTAVTSGRIHHAWLITGPRGIGKATLAWRLAKFLLHMQADDGGMFATAPPTSLEYDPTSPVSHRIDALAEPRLALLRRPYDVDKKRLKTAITVDEVRKLKSFFQMRSADGGYRVALIDAADEMNVQAANALLKILEEPPEKTILLLVCHQPQSLLPTIRSRCQTLACHPLTQDQLSDALETATESATEPSPALAELAGGSVGLAVQLAQSDGVALYGKIVSLASGAPGLDRTRAIALADACVGTAAKETFDLTRRLFFLFVSRVAKFGAMQPNTWIEAAEGEARSLQKLAPNTASAPIWAETLSQLQSRATHGVAVNLDPSSLILDMFLTFDETARRIA